MGWLRKAHTGGDEQPLREARDRLAAIAPGVPGRCPACDGLGYIDNLDLGHRYQVQHCKECGHRWEYLFDEDGVVVGLTELDDAGQPKTRTRIRPLQATPREPDTDPEPDDVAVVPAADPEQAEQIEPALDPDEVAGDDVIDLRTPTVEPHEAPASEVPEAGAAEPAGPEEMSPAEWLRHSLRR